LIDGTISTLAGNSKINVSFGIIETTFLTAQNHDEIYAPTSTIRDPAFIRTSHRFNTSRRHEIPAMSRLSRCILPSNTDDGFYRFPGASER
jgi:hypothetical protein